MSCFWEGIIASLSQDYKDKFGINNNSIPNLIEAFKKVNSTAINVLWQNKELTVKQKEENYTHINDYNVSNYNRGYLCSTCDPFLILLCHILGIDIQHNYLNNEIMYSCKSKKLYVFKSDSGHFVYKNKINK